MELPAAGDPWDLVVALAKAWDLDDATIEGASERGALTVTSPDRSRVLIMATRSDVVRLRLLVTAPQAQARGVLADALEELGAWAAEAGVAGWRWKADGCAGWHCGGSSCLTAPDGPVAAAWRVAWWRRLVGRVLAELGMVSAYGVAASVALYVLVRWPGEKPPGAGAWVGYRWMYAAGDPARSVPVALAAYAAGRLLLVAAALFDRPAQVRRAEVRAAVGPVVLAVTGALLGAGWLR
ncbi:hypothetical protein [Pseudofrankia inefficax]|uniref:hypothetical protein n=1 Tax=Pseudofrankia inefficax (strain DSM 45817 / CECT 9037 / DDB 130130 / EuI1c) TaxID=298654 RepID=UPI0012FE7BC4|nr:hypothetical protein [Pseudofrankia inefficax]